MKDFLRIIMKDYKSENFTGKEWYTYGLIVPAVLVMACILADFINKI